MRSILLAVALAGAVGLALATTFTAQQSQVDAAPGKNLKIYPKTTEVDQIKKDMKVVAKALGVQCDHCHNLDDMSADSDNKTKARAMMQMVGSINDTLKKNGFKDQVTCMTCHAGKQKPPKK
ncbi:MAG TPA: c-type cytochrome [Kofleriaceae bacterium]|nr:c-type cytochrome [Kofleriaceae bacterium]